MVGDGRRAALRRMIVAAAILASGVAHQAQASARVAAFDVPAQPLDAALRELARQGRVQILFEADRLSGRTSRPVRGRWGMRQALDQALGGAGFTTRRVDGRTFVVVDAPAPASRRPAPAPAYDHVEQLPEVPVQAHRPALAGSAAGRDLAREAAELTPVRRLSRADMDRDSAQNLSEALGSLPGMTVVNTGRSFVGGVGSASRAEGFHAAFRGLNSTYNHTMINGVPLAQALPYTRGVQLSLLPPSAFQTVTTHRVGRAALDGDFIGAALDFETPRADVAAPRTALTVSGRIETRALDYGDDGLGGGIRIEHARRLGAQDQVGLYVAVERQERSFVASELAGVMAAQNDNGWAYERSASPSGGPLDPARPQDHLVLTSLNVGVSTGGARLDNQALSLDWRVSEAVDLHLYATHAQADTRQNSTYSQIVSGDHRWSDDGTGAYGLEVDSLSTRVWYNTNPESLSLSTLRLGGDVRSGRWRASPYLFASHGESARPDHIEASVRIDQVDDYNQGLPRPFGGVTVGYRDSLPTPLWPQVVFDDLDQAGQRLSARRAGQLTAQFSRQTRYGAGLDLTFAPTAGAWRSLQFGFKASQSERQMTDRNWTNDHFANLMGRRVTWTDLGLIRGAYAQVFPGLYGWSIPIVDHERLMDYFHAYRTEESLDTCGRLAVNNLNCNTQSGDESVMAAYAMAMRIAGPWEWQGGLRYEDTRIDAVFWMLPQTDGVETEGNWEQSRSRYRRLLPSLGVNYRPDGQTTWRAALWRSYSRPAPTQLGGGATVETVNGVTTITRGNPKLKTVDALNLDLAYHKAWSSGAVFSLSAYFKRLDNYLFENSASLEGGAVLIGDTVRVVMPRNAGRGDVHGLEAEFGHAKDDPLGLGGELSVQFNLSRQWSRVDLGDDALGRDMPMQQAPEWLGNAEIAYRRGRGALYLSYNHTGAYLLDYDVLGAEGDWDNLWIRPVGRLDARAQWRLGPGVALDVVVTNLTGGYSYWSHVGRDSLALSDVIDSGRRMTVSLRGVF